MNVLIIVNDPAYGTEKAYNAFRLASFLQKSELKVRIFLMADAVICALKNQKTPEGYYNLGRMLKGILKRDGEVRACGVCMTARGIAKDRLLNSVKPSNMAELADWVKTSEKIVTF